MRRGATSEDFQVRYAAMDGSRAAIGERRLWASVLRQAFSDYADSLRTTRSFEVAQMSAAGCWIFDDVERVGSFRWICAVFDLDPAAVRGILRTRECYNRIRYLMRPNAMRQQARLEVPF